MTENLAPEFESFHGVKIPDWWSQGIQTVNAVLSARAQARACLATVPESVLSSDPTFGILVHLTERVYEQVAASLICFATKRAAAAEVTARVALESSVNVRMMVQGDRRTLALAWLRDYLKQDKKQISQWSKLVDSLASDEEVGRHRAGLERRKAALEARRTIVAHAELEFKATGPVDTSAKWPNIERRFATINESVAYRTAYARLSSQTHADAEDSINYIAVSGHEELAHRMSEETVAFSEFLVLFAAEFYLASLAELCIAFGFEPPLDVQQGGAFLTMRMAELGEQWGW